MNAEIFDIPIALFLFKRGEKAAQIIHRISSIKPKKIYLIADGPRNDGERKDTDDCRRIVENAIDWSCEIIKNYADVNRGVYENIAGGAQWVFSREKYAIFLEDDNMPELSFFPFCKELLRKYENDSRVLWICGTNYEEVSKFQDNASYAFTQNMMPCGWASWAWKFCKFYDGELTLWKQESVKNALNNMPYDKLLKEQDMRNWDREITNKERKGRFGSWDYQMSFTIRVHNLLGIVPKYNQITNIGVDELSIHGGNSFSNVMTKRFCGLLTRPLEFPLKHPYVVIPDYQYDSRVSKIITLPLSIRLKGKLVRFIKRILNIDRDVRLRKL